jgi:hypothetical protein
VLIIKGLFLIESRDSKQKQSMPAYTALYGFNLPPDEMVRYIYEYGMNCALLQAKTVRKSERKNVRLQRSIYLGN